MELVVSEVELVVSELELVVCDVVLDVRDCDVVVDVREAVVVIVVAVRVEVEVGTSGIGAWIAPAGTLPLPSELKLASKAPLPVSEMPSILLGPIWVVRRMRVPLLPETPDARTSGKARAPPAKRTSEIDTPLSGRSVRWSYTWLPLRSVKTNTEMAVGGCTKAVVKGAVRVTVKVLRTSFFSVLVQVRVSVTVFRLGQHRGPRLLVLEP